MSDERVTHHGKQVMLDGEHLADAVDEDTAEVIALAMNKIGGRLDDATTRRLDEFFA